MLFNFSFSARCASIALSCALLPTAAVVAAEYNTFLPGDSNVGFTYQQMGVNMKGKFTQFDGHLRFDPDRPEQGEASFEVDLSSVDTGTSDGNEEVVGKDWFNVASDPMAT